MEMGKRIGELIKALDISKAKFADSVGTSASRVSNITTGRNKPDALMLERTILHYPHVNAEWLLTGKGNMFKGESASAPAMAPVRPSPSASPEEMEGMQDLQLLRQRADYLERENNLLHGFLRDLRRLMPTLQAPANEPNGQ